MCYSNLGNFIIDTKRYEDQNHIEDIKRISCINETTDSSYRWIVAGIRRTPLDIQAIGYSEQKLRFVKYHGV